MDVYLAAVGSAVWLGILTSISPCPLATNIAAVSFIARQVEKPFRVLIAGVLYTLGRTLAYVVLAVLVVGSVLSIPGAARFLQQYFNQIIGPVLTITGLLLLEVIPIRLPGLSDTGRLRSWAERHAYWGAVLLGVLFALSFCPVSAALFFGSLIPLAIEHDSAVFMPTLYGIGTALPVVVCAITIAISTRLVGVIFKRLTSFERWARRVTAVAILLIGVYCLLSYTLGVLP